jgi:hypothetical protein
LPGHTVTRRDTRTTRIVSTDRSPRFKIRTMSAILAFLSVRAARCLPVPCTAATIWNERYTVKTSCGSQQPWTTFAGTWTHEACAHIIIVLTPGLHHDATNVTPHTHSKPCQNKEKRSNRQHFVSPIVHSWNSKVMIFA